MPDTDVQNPRALDFSNTQELEAQVVDLISDLRQGKIASNEIIQLATQIKTGAQSGDETVKANARALANHLCAFWATNLRTEDGKSPLYGLCHILSSFCEGYVTQLFLMSFLCAILVSRVFRPGSSLLRLARPENVRNHAQKQAARLLGLRAQVPPAFPGYEVQFLSSPYRATPSHSIDPPCPRSGGYRNALQRFARQKSRRLRAASSQPARASSTRPAPTA